MIPVTKAPEPPDFDQKVRQRGLWAIAEMVGETPLIGRAGRRRKLAKRREDIPANCFPPYWRDAIDDMMVAYHGLCAYMAVRIEKVYLPTVDHMIPKSKDWRKVYEWDNYRLACSLMNAKKNDAIDVIDPFRVKPGWFALELVGFQVISGDNLSRHIRQRVGRTIARLGLNEPRCLDRRSDYAEDYWTSQIPLESLLRRAPFVALEIRRQGRLRADDR